jgi:predicted negative regulator of RcsB-dependent stress response
MHILVIIILVILIGYLSYELKKRESFGSLNLQNIAQNLGQSTIAKSENVLSKMSKGLVN